MTLHDISQGGLLDEVGPCPVGAEAADGGINPHRRL